MEEQKNAELERDIQERLAAESPSQEQQKLAQREAERNTRDNVPGMVIMPVPPASPSAFPENRHALKSQAQKFQPRRIVPMTSPITETLTSTPTGENPPVKGEVPQGILNPILNEAAALANVPREQLAVVRAEAVVWNDGSLGCPEPGMEYTQALVNGYWVVIKSAEQTYDFRGGRDGSLRLCPEGHGHSPLPSDAR